MQCSIAAIPVSLVSEVHTKHFAFFKISSYWRVNQCNGFMRTLQYCGAYKSLEPLNAMIERSLPQGVIKITERPVGVENSCRPLMSTQCFTKSCLHAVNLKLCQKQKSVDFGQGDQFRCHQRKLF